MHENEPPAGLPGGQKEGTMNRYIINYAISENAGCSVSSFVAILADSPEEAAEKFSAERPEKILRVIPAGENAFSAYGIGAMTAQEQADHAAKMRERMDAVNREKQRQREAVTVFSLDELAALADYLEASAGETPNADGVHIGDIFHDQYGYDMTLNEFYQVVDLRGKHTAIIRKIASTTGENGYGPDGYERPRRGHFIEDGTFTVRTATDDYKGKKSIRIKAPNSDHHMSRVLETQVFDYNMMD